MSSASMSKNTVFDSTVKIFDVLHRVYMRTIAHLNPVKDCRTVFGATMRCNAREFIQRRLRFFGIFEHNLTYYTLDKLNKGDVYVDIGANVGYFTLLASRCVGPGGKVIAVEADPTTFGALTANLKLNDSRNVSARNVAATGSACRVAVKRGERHNSGSNSVVVGEGDIEGVTLRDLVGQDIGRVSFIKIDIEGSEAPILDAILETLPALSDTVVVASEVSPESASSVARFLGAGFRVYAIQNIYTIDYYLIRSYLRRYGEDKVVNMIPVSGYDPKYRDYIFERAPI